MNAEGRPARAPHDLNITTPDDQPIVTDWSVRMREGHRQRQVARLAAIAAVRGTYGVELRLVPPGPECCPRTCEWCRQAVSA
jgi:hypothetical protein